MFDLLKAIILSTYRTLTGRCGNCGSKNIYEWSAKKAHCEDCGARYY